MGLSGVSMGSLLIVLAIVMLVFGTKRLRTIGSDLGGALSGFRTAIKEGEATPQTLRLEQEPAAAVRLSEERERAAS